MEKTPDEGKSEKWVDADQPLDSRRMGRPGTPDLCRPATGPLASGLLKAIGVTAI
jgi:hypothetical protein